MLRLSSLFALILLGVSIPDRAAAQAAETGAEAAVTATVERLFDAMRDADGPALATLFHPDARLQSVGEQNGTPTLATERIDAFVRTVGAPRSEVWDERIWGLEVRVDGNLATAWMNYAFFVDDQLSHCGINAFQLFNGADGWKVIQVTDTRRREGCERAG